MFWLAQLATLVLSVSAAAPTTTKRADVGTSPFVTVKDGQFYVNGSAFQFVGTTAYWLPALENEQDIDNTLAGIKAANFSVVRTWAFNDVTEIPQNGTWFQHIQSDGTTTINDGPNGLQKLDKVIELASKHGLYVLLSLTNNWNPQAGLDQPFPANFTPSTSATTQSTTQSRNALSNDYGGMDAYVRAFGGPQYHDQFYHNETIRAAFQKYSDTIVSRYANHASVFAWELANDARCNSSLPATNNCQTNLVTQWHADTAKVVKKSDPNHIVSSGTQGFFCADCKKLFPRNPTPPPPAPAPSPAPGSQKKRHEKREPLSKAKLLKERKALWKRERERRKAAGQLRDGVTIRGRWVSSAAKRQADLDVGSAYNGAHGVDTEDIINIPDIGFGSFQLFPDQFDYGTADPTLPKFNQTLQIGLDWIKKHAEAGRVFNKPVSLTGFGLVTQGNSPYFVPFNSSVAPYGNDTPPVTAPYGVTDQERDEAYSQWIQAGVQGGLQGIIQYQWSQSNLTTGSTISNLPDQSGTSQNSDTSGVSPNDGYSTLGQGKQDLLDTIHEASQGFGPDTA